MRLQISEADVDDCYADLGVTSSDGKRTEVILYLCDTVLEFESEVVALAAAKAIMKRLGESFQPR